MGVAVAAIAGMAALGEAVGDSTAKTPAEVRDIMMVVVAIVLSNLMNQFSPVLVSLTFIIQAH